MSTDWYLIAAIGLIALCFALIVAIVLHSARAIAAHESGHAVFLWMSPASSGIASVQAGAFSGTVIFIPTRIRPVRAGCLLSIMGDLSGYAGEAVLLGDCNPSRLDSDLKKASTTAEEYMRRHPDLRESVARTASEAPASIWGARKRFTATASAETADLMTVVLMVCVRILEKNRPGLEAINRALSGRRRLSAEQVTAVLGERPSYDEFWKQLRQELP